MLYLSEKFLSKYDGFIVKGFNGWQSYTIELLRPEWWIPNKTLKFKGLWVDSYFVKPPPSYDQAIQFLSDYYGGKHG